MVAMKEGVGAGNVGHSAGGRNLLEIYRPLYFRDVVGNRDAVRALSGYARQGQRRPFVIWGPSGTGKTALAWILARSYECKGARQDREEPCGVCPVCKELENREREAVSPYASELSCSAWRDSAAACKRILEVPETYPSGTLIVNEAERVGGANTRLLELLEKVREMTFVFTATDPDEFADEFLGRCVVVRTETLDRETIATHLKKISIAEGLPLSDDEISRVLHSVRPNAEGRLRDAITALETELNIRRA